MTREISAVTKSIQSHIPVGMDLKTFIGLAADPNIDDRIAEQTLSLEAIHNTQQIHERPPLSEIALPSLPNGFADFLARTIDDIAQDAETRLGEHLATHGMDFDGSSWLGKGIDYVNGETCPFCGQDIQGLSLIAAYRAVFGERFKALRADINAWGDEIQQRFGDTAVGSLYTKVEQNKAAAEFWGRYCAIDPESVTMPAAIGEALRDLGETALSLLERKARSPLDTIRVDTAFSTAATAYGAAQDNAYRIVTKIRTANALIAAKKEETGVADPKVAEVELERRQAIKIRHADRVAKLCANYIGFTEAKEAIDHRKNEIRTELGMHSENIAKPYEDRINRYLDAFNAGFQVSGIEHGYPSGIAASSYQLVINDTTVDLGSGDTPTSQPSFKNTLSAGDRSTLALAFFLANLDLDQNAATKTVVFDDPFSSQDAFRRRQTVHEIARVARKCAQVIVLSHNANFLKLVWDKTPTSGRIALSLADHGVQGTKIMPIDIVEACKGRTAKDMDDLQTFLSEGKGKPEDLIRKMRVVLETHCWTTFPNCFKAGNDWLGTIVQKIRVSGEQHPAQALYVALDQINDYTGDYHHGENRSDATPSQIDRQELAGYVRRTLRIVNATQA